MNCAVGLCGHCQFGPTFVCKDGPVFPYRPRHAVAARGEPLMPAKPRLAVFKFASCDGCQLSLLDCEDELLAVAEQVEIAYFLEARSRAAATDPTTSAWSKARSPRRTTRSGSARFGQQSRYLVTIGACATAGGIQALRNWATSSEFSAAVYAAARSTSRRSRPRTPIADHVTVDFELCGLPDQQAPAARTDLGAARRDARPRLPSHSVCIECKRAASGVRGRGARRRRASAR